MEIFKILFRTLTAATFLLAVPFHGAHAAPCSGANLIRQAFPVGAATPETSWEICWQSLAKFGLVITHAAFTNHKAAGGAKTVKVFYDARVSEIFVPYHNNSHRFLDVSGFTFKLIPNLKSPTDCPKGTGAILGPNKEVCKEVRDRGYIWKDHDRARRGKEIAVWGVLDAANYNYIIAWEFRDDGVVVARLGASGQVLPDQPFETHRHNVTWRFDLDLDGNTGDSVKLTRHFQNWNTPTEAPRPSTDSEVAITTEKGLVWDPIAYNTLIIRDARLKNAGGKSSGYELVPLRSGTPRDNYFFQRKDFWVTRGEREGENLAINLPTYANGESIPAGGADLVVWYTDSFHHTVRAEDGERRSNGSWYGETLVEWLGVMLKPENLFDRTPFYP